MKICGTSFLILALLISSACRQPKDKPLLDPRPELPVAPGDNDPTEGGSGDDLEAVCQLLEREGMLDREPSDSPNETAIRISVIDGDDSKREGFCPELRLKD